MPQTSFVFHFRVNHTNDSINRVIPTDNSVYLYKYAFSSVQQSYQEADSNLSKIPDLLMECGICFVSADNKNIYACTVYDMTTTV